MSEAAPLDFDPEDGPDELAGIWDDEIKTAFAALRIKQQKFLCAYIREGNAAEAYRQVYNPLASDHLASSCGSQALATNGIKPILRRLADTKWEDLILVRNTFKEAATKAVKPIYAKDADGQPEKVEDIPDYDIRVKAGDRLARLNKLYNEDEADPENPDSDGKAKKVITMGGVRIEVS